MVGAMSVTCTQSCATRPPSCHRTGHCMTRGTRMPPFMVVVLYSRNGVDDTSVQPSGYAGHELDPPSSPASKQRRTDAGSSLLVRRFARLLAAPSGPPIPLDPLSDVMT